MKRKFLPIGLLMGMACVAGSANAVNLSTSGKGEVLLYPFYTIENGQDTYFSVVNTTDLVKAVKVRLRESMNSQEVLSFNLYLSPFDHWSGAITRDPAGAGGLLKTWDTSCTVPQITAAGIKLSNLHFSDFNAQNQNADGGPVGFERTREGFIEVIEMGILDDSAPGLFGAEAAATHSASGIPVDCALLRAAWQEIPVGSGNIVGDWSDPTSNLIFDADWAGGLYGYGVIINVAEGTNATYDAVALESFAGDILHSHPNSAQPNLGSAVPHAKILYWNQFISLDFDLSPKTGLDAVSAVLMHDSIANDFVLEPSIAAGTDWVVTFPTKRDYVNLAEPATLPFLNVWESPGEACEEVQLEYWDRNSANPAPEPAPNGVNFPAPPYFVETDIQTFELCNATNVISFLSPDVDPEDVNLEGYVSALYPSTRSQARYNVEYQNGWARLTMAEDNFGNDRILTADDDTEIYGLPVIGFAVQKYANTNLSGVNGSGAFYSGVINHKSTQLIDMP